MHTATAGFSFLKEVGKGSRGPTGNATQCRVTQSKSTQGSPTRLSAGDGRPRRAVVIVLDGVGAGAAPDAAIYGDQGANSLGNAAKAVGGLNAPHLAALGLGCITPIPGLPNSAVGPCGYGRLQPQSPGKDTVSGHWELMGIRLAKAFPTYPNGFPEEILTAFTRQIGRDVLGNKAASGTQIIQELGAEHLRTGKPILYTSADSVFQVAAHEEVIPVAELHRICRLARGILKGDHAVGRVIARPFLGTATHGFRRTANRRDYPLAPESPTLMDRLKAAGKSVITIGKIDDIFAGRGFTRSCHTTDNASSTAALLTLLEEDFEGLLFANLIEFDMIYGHRRDPHGYIAALEEFDRHLPALQQRLHSDDLVMIVADHGVDSTAPGSDHTREYVPLLVFGPGVRRTVDLGIRPSLSDVAATLAEAFRLEPPPVGESFLTEVAG